MELTKIQRQKTRKSRYNIFVNYKYAFSITEADLIREKVVTGPIDETLLEKLKENALVGILYEYAIEHETRRPHSLVEHKRYLYKKAKTLIPSNDIGEKYIKLALEKLINNGYQNDNTFSEWLIKQRQTSARPKGKTAIIAELRTKGVSNEIIQKTISTITDEQEIENAQKLADKKKKQLLSINGTLTKVELRNKLTKFLLSRGYSYNMIKCIQLI